MEEMQNIPYKFLSIFNNNKELKYDLLLYLGKQEDKRINHWLITNQIVDEKINIIINEFYEALTIIPGSILKIA